MDVSPWRFSHSEGAFLMCVIGITGSLGTGKSTVARMFMDFGAKVLDADRIAHQQMLPGAVCFRPIVKTFGKDILTAGRIDRKKVAARVFLDIKQLRKLEQIVHPAVRKVIIAKIRQYKKNRRKSVMVIDIPLLFESKLNRYVDFTIVVKASRTKQILRATKNLGMTKVDALRHIRAQMPLRQKIRLADIIIDNDGSLIKTKKQVVQIWEKL